MDQYITIAKALSFIQEHYFEQPNLEAIAAEVNLSPFHLQRIFTEWAGVSPKKFLQYLSIERAKKLLQNSSILDTAYKIGLSGTSRLHDLFMTIEGMTPGEYKNGGAGLTIYYSLKKSLFGKYLVASTEVGVCNILFYDTDSESAIDDLVSRWPGARIIEKEVLGHIHVQQFFNHELGREEKIKLHLKGTPFQLKVWEALLRIPEGQLTSYGSVAESISKPTAQRAVGSAIGANPVAYLIPCHRVIKNNGVLGNFGWGIPRKMAMVGWEGAQVKKEDVMLLVNNIDRC
jgi:AraC family transcriptional regulator of adaptative response/methylated-DNA-[protein]-cysteine methyltransferase